MADLEQLKQKYASVIATIQEFAPEGATLDDVSLDGDKLHLRGIVPSQVIANRVWDAIKAVDPTYADLHHEIVTSGSADQNYTVKSGDNLSISASISMERRTTIRRLRQQMGWQIRI